jgi:hypothetical protein
MSFKSAITHRIDSIICACVKVRNKRYGTRDIKNSYPISHIPFPCISYLFLLCSLTFAAESGLVSNSAFAVGPGPEKSSVWVFSRGDAGSGLSLVTLGINSNGISAARIQPEYLDDTLTAVQDGVFSDLTAEHRRTPAVNAGSLGWVLPLISYDKASGGFLKPYGLLLSRGVNAVYSRELAEPAVTLPQSDRPMDKAVSAFAYDESAKKLWFARGKLGVGVYDVSKGANSPVLESYAPNIKTLHLDTLAYGMVLDSTQNPAVFGMALHPETSELWLATERGLFVKKGNALQKVEKLKSERVTGIWIGGEPVQAIAEISGREKTSTRNLLFRSYAGKDFEEVIFKDTLGKMQKNIYDNADYSVSSVAFLGAKSFLAVQTIEGNISGLLKLDSIGAIPWENENQWLYALNAGVVNRNVTVTSVTAFPFSDTQTGLAVSTYGAGISVSADSGKTWSYILNQGPVGDNLGSIRMVPSVIPAGGTALVAYKVSKDSKITIEIFSYDMRKIRTIIKSAPRPASSVRSSLATEDFWDGFDDRGRIATMGIYYVRVKDNHGHVGWGKVMTLGGKK